MSSLRLFGAATLIAKNQLCYAKFSPAGNFVIFTNKLLFLNVKKCEFYVLIRDFYEFNKIFLLKKSINLHQTV